MIGIGLTIQEVIAILVLVGAIIAFWTKFNVKFSEHDRDIILLKSEIVEHKTENKGSFDKLEISLKENRIENKEEHKELKADLAGISTVMSDLTHTIIQNIK